MSENARATRSPFADLWSLDPSVAYLNHGSFGACPKAVLDYQAELVRRMEREPSDFLWRELPDLLAAARTALATFVGAEPDDLAFVPNATAAVNAVVRSLPWQEGDEILTTNHTYPACRKALQYATSRHGARIVTADVPFPLAHEDDIVAAVLGAVTPNTRLALLDHVTSPTALVFPVQRLVEALSARGVDTFVDGAHAVGMVPLDLTLFGAAYYTSNAHKWLCAPKGAAFLHVRRDRQRGIHPTSISHGWAPGEDESRFRAEFDWTGTCDPTAFLSVPAAIKYLGELLPGGWSALMERNRALALRARRILCDALGVAPPCHDTLIGAIASVPLPDAAPGSAAAGLDHEGLMNWFRERGIETWFYSWPEPGRKVIRVSAQIYNDESQYVRLASLLSEAMRGG